MRAQAEAGAVLSDTIVAVSSPPGAGPRAVVRLSGPAAWELAGRVFADLPQRAWRQATGHLQLPGWPQAPARALCFRGPRSYTGEDTVELWVPGAAPLVRRLIVELQAAGARLARRGEFSRRAFLRGRLDLTQVEAVLALVSSDDAAQARAALRVLGGGLRGRIDAVKAQLIDVVAHVEAAIDFSDEELDHAPPESLAKRLHAAEQALGGLLSAGRLRPQAGTEAVIALRGPANAGKSTLLNALTGEDAALVSGQAGTTRDVVAGAWHLGEQSVRLLDTAGQKVADNTIEAQALEIAAEAGQGADVVLVVADGRDPEGARAVYEAAAWPKLLVLNKADLVPDARPWEGAGAWVRVSAETGAGLELIRERVQTTLQGGGDIGTRLLGTARQEAALHAAAAAASRARALVGGGDPAWAELAAIDLAEALEFLGSLTGEVTSDHVLDRLFSSFCVGK